MKPRLSFYYFVLLFFGMVLLNKTVAQTIIPIEKVTTVIPQGQPLWYIDSSGQQRLQQVQSKTFSSAPVLHSIKKEWAIWAHFSLANKTTVDQEYILQVPKAGYAFLYTPGNNNSCQVFQTGSLLPLDQRSEPSNINAFRLLIKKEEIKNIWLQLKPVYSLYLPHDLKLQLTTQNHFEHSDRKRLFWQGMFLGVLLVMAFYNLFLLFAVKDISYLYYVLSFVSLGIYFAFYYGFGIEWLWPNSPVWDTFCYTMLVPFTGLSRILFTKTYLHTSQLLPSIDKWLNVLIAVTAVILLTGIISYAVNIDLLVPLINVIGILGAIILIMMLVAGIRAYQKDYEPAKYFIVANIVLVIGAIAFIFREMGLLTDNYFTRYVVQYGVLIQLVVFSLGLASRLNRTRLQLVHETLEKERLALEKEREKKELIEQQKSELQQQVARQTGDLQQKNIMLQESISQLKDSQYQLSQLNNVKDKLFSVISHDLRNPVATMQSFMKLLTDHHDKLSEEEKQKMFAEAQQSLDNLNLLLYNLLQWSRSQMNILQFKPEKVNIKSVTERCVRLLQLNAHMKQIIIAANIDQTLSGLGDKEMIEFVIRNLLSNAIKFSHRNSTIKINAYTDEEKVIVEVVDNGIGMSDQRIQKLLELNTAVTRRGTEKEKGTGLGLLISKEFIEKNGGSLKIKSEPGHGSTFIFSIPLYMAKVFT